jgi:hypothetical protein
MTSMSDLLNKATGDAFWRDYSYTAGRSRPVGVTHCQEHHSQREESNRAHAARGGTVRGYSVKLRPSEPATCATCGKVRPTRITGAVSR